MGIQTRIGALLITALLVGSGCWRMQDVGQYAADGGDTGTGDTEETDGITDPDTQWAGQWSYSEMETPTTADLAAVWGTWFGNVWAVGEDGVILHFDGTGWTLESDVPTNLNLHAIAGASADLVWAAGASRVMLEFDGEQWQQLETVFSGPEPGGGYRDLCVKSAMDGNLVGEGATIAEYSGLGWNYGVEAALDGDFHGVTCRLGSDAFIAGHNHAAFSSSMLIRYDDWLHDWELMDHESSDNMYGIAADDDGNVWAVGFDDGVGSKLYRNNGEVFDVETTSDDELLGLWAHSSMGVWAVGNTADDDHVGVIQAWNVNGDSEYHVEFDGTSRLRGIWGIDNVSDQHLFAVGKNGTILHLFWDPF